MDIIRASTEEISELAPLFSGYRHFYEQTVDISAEHDYLSQRLVDGDCTIFMARHSAEAAGFVLLYPTFDSVMLSPVWVLHDLYVAADHRRSGLGRKLMGVAHDFCRQNGAHRVDLSTAVTNTVAQPLYESMGYERDEEFYSYSLSL
jgi:ribosomal protein S18 acetylase RimI-like enzyme